MQNQPEVRPGVRSDANSDALADAAQFVDRLALGSRDGRLSGSEKKRGVDTDVLKRLAEDAGFEGGDVGRDVGQFRHSYHACPSGRHLQALASPAEGMATQRFTLVSEVDSTMKALLLSKYSKLE